MNNFLKNSPIINYTHPSIKKLAHELAKEFTTDVQITKSCFEFVRDEINHSGDYKDDRTTCTASDVLEQKTGWCYAKSHLLAALLRANSIPTGFCYQRLSCSEYKDDIFCLHGLNAVYLKEYGWYKVDPRGNKEGVNAQFNPPIEQLAFTLQENEYDIDEIFEEPLEVVVHTLQTYTTYDDMINNFPDYKKDNNG